MRADEGVPVDLAILDVEVGCLFVEILPVGRGDGRWIAGACPRARHARRR